MSVENNNKSYYLQMRGYSELAPGIVGKLEPYTVWFFEKGLILPIKGIVVYIKDKYNNKWVPDGCKLEIDKNLFKREYPWYPW